MTFRAIIIGLLLAFGISIFTYFNDHIIQQTFLIGNHFPIAVFGPVLILLLAINPLFSLLRVKSLRPMEIALITALGLSVCGWPGSSFFRSFSALLTVPSNMLKTETGWQATHVMSYIPGVSPLLGEGHVRDWPGLVKALENASHDSTPSPARRIWDLLPERTRAAVASGFKNGRLDQSEKADIVNSLDDILGRTDFYSPQAFASLRLPPEISSQLARIDSLTDRGRQALNRALLECIFPNAIMPPPRGEGILLVGGDVQSPAFQTLMQGWTGKKKLGVFDLPWKAWRPTLIFWGGLALLLAIAAVCLVVIVQPQWKRELLAYPIARFVQEIAQPAEKGGLPAVFRSKLFWYGFALIFIIHIVDGLQVWFPGFIQIPLSFSFIPLSKLFPNAYQFQWAYTVFMPHIYATVVGFAFFLSTEVSFSMGISGILFIALYGILVASGVAFSNDFIGAASGNMLRIGAYVGSAVMVFFVGRHYYLNVLGSCFGMRRKAEIPRNAVWAMRLLIVCFALCVVLLRKNSLDWVLGSLLIAFILLCVLVMTRINAETGTFFIQPMWVPVGVITALFGIQAIGPTAYIIMALISTVFVVDPRETVMPFVSNALYMTTPGEKKAAPTGMAIFIGAMVIVGFVAALCATLYYQYNHGLNFWDGWVTRWLPKYPFDAAATNISELSAYNELTKSLTMGSLDHFSQMSPKMDLMGWGLLGVALVVVASLLRLLFAWWPLHPVCFLVWGTMPGMYFAWSFLIGWGIKTGVVRMSGVKGYRTVKPFMIGLIGGELLAALCWILVGSIYYMLTGLVPKSYLIFP